MPVRWDSKLKRFVPVDINKQIAASGGPVFGVSSSGQTSGQTAPSFGGLSGGGGGPGTPTQDRSSDVVSSRQTISAQMRNPSYNWDLLGDPGIGQEMDRQQWNDLIQRMGGPSYDEYQAGLSPTQYYGAVQQANQSLGAETIKPVTEVKWKEGKFDLETPAGAGAPEWWKPLIPEDSKDMERPDVAYAAMLNTMIPYMSPEDQRRAAGDIYTLLGGAHFGKYHEVSGDPSVPITKLQADLGAEGQVIDQEYFQSRQRATGAINALNQLRTQTVGGNREKIGGTGQGYRWLQNALEQAISYGGGFSRKQEGTEGAEGQSRAQYLAMQGALDPIMAQAQSLGPVGSIGQMLMQPFFSQGGVRPTQRTESGRVLFGQPNALLFG